MFVVESDDDVSLGCCFGTSDNKLLGLGFWFGLVDNSENGFDVISLAKVLCSCQF